MGTRRRPSNREIDFMTEVDGAIYRRGSSMAYLLSATIVLMLSAFIFWAHRAVLDEVTRGAGQAIPSQQVQVIQIGYFERADRVLIEIRIDQQAFSLGGDDLKGGGTQKTDRYGHG